MAERGFCLYWVRGYEGGRITVAEQQMYLNPKIRLKDNMLALEADRKVKLSPNENDCFKEIFSCLHDEELECDNKNLLINFILMLPKYPDIYTEYGQDPLSRIKKYEPGEYEKLSKYSDDIEWIPLSAYVAGKIPPRFPCQIIISPASDTISISAVQQGKLCPVLTQLHRGLKGSAKTFIFNPLGWEHGRFYIPGPYFSELDTLKGVTVSSSDKPTVTMSHMTEASKAQELNAPNPVNLDRLSYAFGGMPHTNIKFLVLEIDDSAIDSGKDEVLKKIKALVLQNKVIIVPIYGVHQMILPEQLVEQLLLNIATALKKTGYEAPIVFLDTTKSQCVDSKLMSDSEMFYCPDKVAYEVLPSLLEIRASPGDVVCRYLKTSFIPTTAMNFLLKHTPIGPYSGSNTLDMLLKLKTPTIFPVCMGHGVELSEVVSLAARDEMEMLVKKVAIPYFYDDIPYKKWLKECQLKGHERFTAFQQFIKQQTPPLKLRANTNIVRLLCDYLNKKKDSLLFKCHEEMKTAYEQPASNQLTLATAVAHHINTPAQSDAFRSWAMIKSQAAADLADYESEAAAALGDDDSGEPAALGDDDSNSKFIERELSECKKAFKELQRKTSPSLKEIDELIERIKLLKSTLINKRSITRVSMFKPCDAKECELMINRLSLRIVILKMEGKETSQPDEPKAQDTKKTDELPISGINREAK